MLHDAVEAFVTQDAELARKTMGAEERSTAARRAQRRVLDALRSRTIAALEALRR